MNPILCPGEHPYFFLFDFSTAPRMLFYTYIPAIVISLFLGFFVWRKDKYSFVSRLLFFITVFFSLWVLDILVLWVASYNDVLMFGWQLTPMFEVPLFIFSIYFALVMTNKQRRDISPLLKLFFIGLMLIVFVFLPTRFNMINYDISNCEGTPGLFFYSMYITEIISIIILIWVCIKRYFSIVKTDIFRKEVLYVSISIISFLILFTGSNIIGQLTEIQEISFLGSLGMVIFLGILVYLIVRFHTFNIKLLASQALVWVLVFLIGSQFFFIKVPINFVLTGITFLGVIVFGQFLINSVKKEIEQKEKLQNLTIELVENNKKLKAFDLMKSKFLSLASHQLRNPISTIVACTSMFLDGSFGQISELQKKMLTQMFQGAQDMNDSVEKYLTIAKIDQGGLQYNLEKLDLCQLTESITERQKLAAEKRNLALSFETDIQPPCFVNGDKVQLKQVIQNLIDNAIKYTKEGWIKVKLSKDEVSGKVRLAVSDSGMGIKPEIISELFKEFSRGEGAKVDVGGSGIGLFLAKEIIEKGHHGRIWAESDGADKGSTFIAELPLFSENMLS